MNAIYNIGMIVALSCGNLLAGAAICLTAILNREQEEKF